MSTCKDCKFFEVLLTAPSGAAAGVCHRYPPSPVLVGDLRSAAKDGIPGVDVPVAATPPGVSSSWWCGEWGQR